MIESYGAPDSKTPGNVGDVYRDLDTGILYQCTNVEHPVQQQQYINVRKSSPETVYTWVACNSGGGGGQVVLYTDETKTVNHVNGGPPFTLYRRPQTNDEGVMVPYTNDDAVTNDELSDIYINKGLVVKFKSRTQGPNGYVENDMYLVPTYGNIGSYYQDPTKVVFIVGAKHPAFQADIGFMALIETIANE